MKAVQHATDWMRRAGYGLFFHFLPDGNAEQFQDYVNGYDVEGFAKDCAETGAGYVFITLCQNSGFLNVPCSAYDRHTGYEAGEKTARRDLVADLYTALNANGIKLMLYMSSLAPGEDRKAASNLGCTMVSEDITRDWIVTDKFSTYWSEILQELSDRYGSKVSGWWMDGSYTWVNFTEKTAKVYSKALKHGNPNSLISFNPGEGVLKKYMPYDDYTAGEYNNLLAPKCSSSFIDGIQWHQLSYVTTENWGAGKLQYTDEQITAHLQDVMEHGGVVTLDLPYDIPYVGGRIRQDAKEQLKRVRTLLGR